MRQCTSSYVRLLCSIFLWWAINASALEASAPPRIQISDVALGLPVLDKTVEVWERGMANEAPLQVAALPSNEIDGFHTVTAKALEGRFDMTHLWLRLALHGRVRIFV